MTRIIDVAQRAGVSPGTVSNVFNRPAAVAPATRLRVERAVAELGYIRHEPARQLRAGASRTVALVVLDVANPFYADVITGAEDAADALGDLVVVCNSAGEQGREDRHLDQLVSQRVRGVVLSPVRAGPHRRLDELDRAGIPVVLVDQMSQDRHAASVSVDDERGGALVGEHLREQGHSWVAVVAGPRSLPQVQDRLRGLRAAVGAEVRVDVVDTEGMTVGAGSRAMAALLSRWPDPVVRPTAVFCTSDVLAIGALNQCLRDGLRVSRDVAIVGYDDIDFAEGAAVPLTSVRQPARELGRRAVELLHMDQRLGTTATHVVFAPELVIRDSSRGR